MTKPLEMERFRMLASAYGSDISRWPLAEQPAATLRAAEPEAASVLREARHLDGILNEWVASPPSAMLVDRALRSSARFGADTTRRFRIWWAGIGLAAALSGAAAGSLGAASISATASQAYGSTLFGEIPDEAD